MQLTSVLSRLCAALALIGAFLLQTTQVVAADAKFQQSLDGRLICTPPRHPTCESFRQSEDRQQRDKIDAREREKSDARIKAFRENLDKIYDRR